MGCKTVGELIERDVIAARQQHTGTCYRCGCQTQYEDMDVEPKHGYLRGKDLDKPCNQTSCQSVTQQPRSQHQAYEAMILNVLRHAWITQVVAP
jgi:hypothetical protein